MAISSHRVDHCSVPSPSPCACPGSGRPAYVRRAVAYHHTPCSLCVPLSPQNDLSARRERYCATSVTLHCCIMQHKAYLHTLRATILVPFISGIDLAKRMHSSAFDGERSHATAHLCQRKIETIETSGIRSGERGRHGLEILIW